MNDIDRQEKIVLWAYVVQWTTLVMPPALIASLIFLLLIRGRITHVDIRSHVNWQLATFGMIAAMIPIALILFFVGLSGVNTDSLISILSTFALVGASTVLLPWLFYRLLYGTMRFSRQLPMERLFP